MDELFVEDLPLIDEVALLGVVVLLGVVLLVVPVEAAGALLVVPVLALLWQAARLNTTTEARSNFFIVISAKWLSGAHCSLPIITNDEAGERKFFSEDGPTPRPHRL